MRDSSEYPAAERTACWKRGVAAHSPACALNIDLVQLENKVKRRTRPKYYLLRLRHLENWDGTARLAKHYA